MKKGMKLLFTFLGIIIFIFCITMEVDGIGRFACVLFGTIFCLIGSYIKNEKGSCK